MGQIEKEEILVDKDADIEKLCIDTVALVEYARNIATQQVNIVQLLTYYSIGKWIVEVQQKGECRAKYGKHVIRKLSDRLQKEFGRGFSKTNLEYIRRFYLMYEDRITQTVFRQFAIEKTQTLFGQLEEDKPFLLSWSHYLQLMRIENEDERSFYWS